VAQVWRAQVGRVPLLLLDTNISANSPEDQDITTSFTAATETYASGRRSCSASAAIGPSVRSHDAYVCHMNEGHSAFQCLERIRCTMLKEHVDFTAARELCIAGNVFTRTPQCQPALTSSQGADDKVLQRLRL